MRGREIFYRLKTLISLIVGFWKIFPKRLRIILFNHFRNINGKIGLGLRYTLLRSIAKECGDNVSVFPGCFILEPSNLVVGNNVSIQPMCYIDATGGIEIQDSVSIAHGSTIMSTDHDYKGNGIDIKDQQLKLGVVKIENNTWIGAHSTILKNVHIPSGSVIAAGAVVTSKLVMDSNCVWGGVPAKLLKHR